MLVGLPSCSCKMAKKSQAKKRLFTNFDDIEPSMADVHCAIESISPPKKAKSGVEYFDGLVSDGTRRLRIVGFNMKTLQQLSDFHTKNEAVKLDNCQIKKSLSEELELVVNRTTSVSHSPFKFNVVPLNNKTIEVTLTDLDNLDDGTKITVRATVLSVAPVRPVSTGKVQEIIICDSTASTNLSAWENHTDQLIAGKSYLFGDVFVRSYRGEKSISLSRQSVYTEIESTEMNLVDEETDTIEGAKIIGCQHFVIHLSCVSCDGKLEFKSDSRISAKCTKCGIVQLTKDREYDMAATLLIKVNNDNTKFLKICTDNILKILPDFNLFDPSVCIEERLLTAPQMTVVYSTKMGYIKDLKFSDK